MVNANSTRTGLHKGIQDLDQVVIRFGIDDTDTPPHELKPDIRDV